MIAAVIEIDRWGNLLLERTATSLALPVATSAPGESPDETALRAFEAATGEILEDLKLFRMFPADGDHGPIHVYYLDADLDAALLGERSRVFEYLAPAALPGAPLEGTSRTICEAFVSSPAYRALFH